MGNTVHKVQRDPVELVTVEHDKVVLEDQERAVRDENNSLLFIVPVIHPEKKRHCVRSVVTNLFWVSILYILNKQNLLTR